MQDRKNAGSEECRIGRMQDRKNAGVGRMQHCENGGIGRMAVAGEWHLPVIIVVFIKSPFFLPFFKVFRFRPVS
jgi:hypothetical protein